MKAKRILAGVCASVMLAAAAVPVVSAADSVKVTVSNAKAKAGETFSVTVDLADIPAAGINGCDFGISYDASVVSITGVEKGALAVDDTDALDGVKSLETNVESGLVSVIYGVSGTKVTGSGTFVKLTGKINSTAAAGTKSDIKIVAIDRTAKPAGSDKNADIIFGYLQDDNKTFVNYTPTIVNGVVEVEGEATEQPTTQAPATEQPTTQAPATEQPTTQAPATEQPTTQAPATEQPTTQAPATEQPTTQAPATEQPTTQQPVIEQPTTQQPTTQQPVIEQPTTQPGAIDNPTTEAPKGDVNKPDPSKVTKLGDVDKNGYVELNDIVVLAKYLLNSKANPLDEVQLANADATQDGRVDVSDLSKIIEHNLNPAKTPIG
jgi:hypothetical protein